MRKNPDTPKKPLWRRFLRQVWEWTLFFIILAIAIRLIAPSKLFHPSRDDAAHTELLTWPNTEHLTFEAGRDTISGYLLLHEESPAPLLLYFGGNSENAANFVRYLAISRRRYFPEWHLAQIDYPGYGQSEGRPSDASLKRTALAAYDALADREDVTEIVVLGYSIGTGPANYVAAKRDVDGLILMAPYADGVDLFNTVVNVFHGPLKLLVSYNMSSVTFAEDIAVKPLIFATEQDELVPYASSVRLSEAYPAGCEFVTVPGIRHGGFWNNTLVLKSIAAYLDEVAANE